jgi:hypothetical protein
MVLLLVSVIGIISIGLNKTKLARLTAWVSLILVLLLFVAAYLKVHTSFSFIPFKSFAGFLSKQIKFKWGWYVLYTGPVVALAGSMIKRSQYSR